MTPGNFSSLDDNPMLHDPSLPNLNAETVSSILDGSGEMDNQFANMGYDASPGGGISERIANDWNDYDYPPSVDNSGEEQMVDESIEAFEERVLNKRAAQLFVTVRAKLIKEDKILLSDMTYRNTKKQVRSDIIISLSYILTVQFLLLGCTKILFSSCFKEVSNAGN